MFDFAVLAKRRADEADRITAVALNFEMKGKRFVFDGYQISTSINNNKSNNASCMATHEITDGCGLSTEAVLPLNRIRRRVYSKRWVLYAKRPFGGPQQVLSYLANYTHRVALSNRRIVAVDALHQTVTFTYRDYRHGSQRKELTLSALEFIRRFSLHILPPGLVRIRHYGILGNNRRKRDIEAARAIFISRGRAVELQPRSVADPPCSGMCCPSCGNAGIRLVAFTDAAGVLHMIGAWPMPCDSS